MDRRHYCNHHLGVEHLAVFGLVYLDLLVLVHLDLLERVQLDHHLALLGLTIEPLASPRRARCASR